LGRTSTAIALSSRNYGHTPIQLDFYECNQDLSRKHFRTQGVCLGYIQTSSGTRRFGAKAIFSRMQYYSRQIHFLSWSWANLCFLPLFFEKLENQVGLNTRSRRSFHLKIELLGYLHEKE
jgi:hypothetical protein